MEKIILVDGTNLVFRSYYATAYNGNLMQNSKGFPTNALFGFANMINKIVLEEKPTYMIVAFDKGKTFRHEKYASYKAGRSATPEELKAQIPLCKELLTCMGIKYYECDNYEADDILGTFAKYCDDEPEFIGTIISSDKDLLQLISKDVEMKLLKQKDYIRYNEKTFEEAYGIPPIRVIDLKALMGDSSDNIPGVAGIGEKTALKLLTEYQTLDGIYDHLEELTPKMREKLTADKENAYMSYELATIERQVPMEIDLADVKVKPQDHEALNHLYEELEFFSFLAKDNKKEEKPLEDVTVITSVDEINLDKKASVYLEILGSNYHTSKVLGIGVYNDQTSFFIPAYFIKQAFPKIKEYMQSTYDLKKLYVALRWMGIEDIHIDFDLMIASSLLEYNVKDDIAYLANTLGYAIPFYENVYKKSKGSYIEPDEKEIAKVAVAKAKFIYEIQPTIQEKIDASKMKELFYEIEMPLALVLGDMEYDGVFVDKAALESMGEEMKIKLELLEKDIYNDAGCAFNIASPKQLGDILFEKLHLKASKKSKTGYSTSVEVLEKLVGEHPIIEKLLSYRTIMKLYTTYVEGLKNYILQDGKIHTIYTQTLTRTGRLSSIEPNLQNIPVRNEYGKLIRKVFIPSKDSIIVSGDYSQIELRILAHIAHVDTMIEAFRQDEDIHTHTAGEIFKVEEKTVTSNMRRMAKAVNFGIIYGISSYGLSENVGITPKEAKEFIENYLNTYPGIKAYMDHKIEEAHALGYVETLFGRKRVIEELKNKNYMIRQAGERIALNTPIQGTSADIIKKAMVMVHQAFKENNLKSKMIIQVHDELVFDCLKEEKEKVIQIVTDLMEHVIELSVPLKIDIEYGDNWYQAK